LNFKSNDLIPNYTNMPTNNTNPGNVANRSTEGVKNIVSKGG
jgi:hypothetical protein